jgi:hypothetical protein
MKRTLATVSAIAFTLAAPGLALAQAQPQTPSPRPLSEPTPPAASDSMTTLPGTGTAEVKGNKLIGADVKGPANEKIGDVSEVLVTTDGRINAVIVSVGGFLGMGDRKVAMPWEQLRFSSEGSQLVVMANTTKESLKAMPEYRDPDRAAAQQPARSGATDMNGRAGLGGTTGPRDTSRPIRPAPAPD